MATTESTTQPIFKPLYAVPGPDGMTTVTTADHYAFWNVPAELAAPLADPRIRLETAFLSAPHGRTEWAHRRFYLTVDGGLVTNTPFGIEDVLADAAEALTRPPVVCPGCGETDNGEFHVEENDDLTCLTCCERWSR